MIQSILWAILGGGIIGLAASWLLLSNGRIAGVSGIIGGLIGAWDKQSTWRLSFLSGLLVGGFMLMTIAPHTIVAPQGRTIFMLAGAGMLVGYGTRESGGCTSGHGVCGLTRFSPRSFVATLTFMTTGFVTATLIGILGVSS